MAWEIYLMVSQFSSWTIGQAGDTMCPAWTITHQAGPTWPGSEYKFNKSWCVEKQLSIFSLTHLAGIIDIMLRLFPKLILLQFRFSQFNLTGDYCARWAIGYYCVLLAYAVTAGQTVRTSHKLPTNIYMRIANYWISSVTREKSTIHMCIHAGSCFMYQFSSWFFLRFIFVSSFAGIF